MKRGVCAIAILMLVLNMALAQSTKQTAAATDKKAASQNVQPAATTMSGSGTPGRVAKWAGVSGSSAFTLGDSNIFEDKFGKVGIGTTTPTSLLTVKGMIETTLGGLKFPDGTIQTTAAAGLRFVFTDSTLHGDGTSGFPLGVNIPL